MEGRIIKCKGIEKKTMDKSDHGRGRDLQVTPLKMAAASAHQTKRPQQTRRGNEREGRKSRGDIGVHGQPWTAPNSAGVVSLS